MPKFKFEEIEKTIGAAKLYPVYLIYGSEDFLIRLLITKITDVYKAEATCSVERHSAIGLNASELIDSMKTMSLWSTARMVIISDASQLSPKSKEQFEAYLASPLSSIMIVFTAVRFDGRSKLYKMILDSGAVIEIGAVYPNQMPFWISRECKSKGYSISQDASQFMTELVGTNLSDMSSAVEKIALYKDKKDKMIDLKDVETVLSDTSQKSIFDLTGALGEKNLSQAANRLVNLLRNNEEPVIIVNMIARHWRLLIKTKEFFEQNPKATQYELASKIGMPPFIAKNYINQAKKFTKRQLIAGLKHIWEADVLVKSSRLSNDLILSKLSLELLR